MGSEFKRSFLEWSSEDVCNWLSTLALSKDYSNAFRDEIVTGSTLISMDREALEDIGITDDADRLKILQQITSMRADIVTLGAASPSRRQRSPLKSRKFSDNVYPSILGGQFGRGNRPPRSRAKTMVSNQNARNRYVNLSVQQGQSSPRTSESGTSVINSPTQLSIDQTSSDSQESSRISTPDKPLHHDISFSDVECSRQRKYDQLNKIHTVATLRYHNVKRLSRSLDRFFPDGEDIFSVYNRAAQADERAGDYSSSSRLVDILREENMSLKQELETYYQRVRRLQKVEQEVENIREGHRMLEASTVRREGLEKALRAKLEQEVWRLKEDGIRLRAELSVAKKQTLNATPSEKNGSSKREIRRRDTMIMRLIQQNKEAAIAREQLEKDLHSTKAQLKDTSPSSNDDSRSNGSRQRNFSSSDFTTEPDSKTAMVYSESIDKLKAVLSAMHNMSHKREKLEKKLRFQLEREIKRLKEHRKGSLNEEGITEKLAELQLRNSTLDADVVKWEHKCLELVAEKQMTFEAAVIPKEARIAALERSLAEKIDTLHEMRHQKSGYLSQLSDAKRRITELEIELASVQSSLQEKDSVIQMMQKSFLEPEEDSFSSIRPVHPSSPSTRNVPPPPPRSNSLVTVPPSHQKPPPYGSTHNGHHHPTLSRPDPPTSHPVLPPSPPYPIPPPHLPLPPKPSYTLPVKEAFEGEREVAQQATDGEGSSRSSGQSRSITGTVRNSPLTSPSTNRMIFPPKVSTGRGISSISGNKYTQDDPPKRKNGYAAVGKYIPGPSLLQHQSGYSSSAPNSPNIQAAPRKPRISHPNLHLLQVPAPPEYGFNRQQPNIRRKANTNPGGMRRRIPCPREVKSKTPPPDYRLVSVAGGRRNSNGSSSKLDAPKVVQAKQRHHSLEDMLSTDVEKTTLSSGSKFGVFSPQQRDNTASADPYPSASSMELFQSLVGGDNDGRTGSFSGLGGGEGRGGLSGSVHARSAHSLNRTPQSQHREGKAGLVSSLQILGSHSSSYGDQLMGTHQHSKSSPTNDRRIHY